MIYCEKRMKLRAEFVVFDDFDISFFLLEVSHRDHLKGISLTMSHIMSHIMIHE